MTNKTTATDRNTASAATKCVTQPRTRRMARACSAEGAVNDPADSAGSPPPQARAPSKIDQVLALLRRGEGATLAELVEATGWLPHTTRAALTGLRKKGHVLAKDKRGEATCYRITEAA
jgi:hypothetical protein